jgi:hypothetical protein
MLQLAVMLLTVIYYDFPDGGPEIEKCRKLLRILMQEILRITITLHPNHGSFTGVQVKQCNKTSN